MGQHFTGLDLQVYVFLFASTNNIVQNFFPRSNDGVCHADELFMLFKAHQVPVTMVRSDADKRVGAFLLDLLIIYYLSYTLMHLVFNADFNFTDQSLIPGLR